MYGPNALLPALAALSTDLGLDRYWLVGHSLGAAVATRLAMAEPDDVRGVIVTNSRAMFGLSRHSRSISPPVSLAERRELPFHPIHAKRFPESLQETMAQAADHMPAHAIAHMAANAPKWSSADDLSRLAVLALLINGMWEKAFQPHIDVARQEIPDITIVDLAGGHSINIEQPEGFDDAVRCFTQEVDARE